MFKKANSRNWYTTIMINGKRRTVSLKTPDVKLARLHEQKLRIRYAEGKVLDKPKGTYWTVNALLDKYLDQYSRVKKKSYQTDLTNAKPLRRLGAKKLTDIDSSTLADYEANRLQEGASTSTIRLELSLLSHSFSLAVKPWKLLEVSPFVDFKLPPQSRERIRFLSPEERQRLFETIRKCKCFRWMTPVVITLLETGARLSNVLELEWSQIDFRKRKITFLDTKSGRPLTLPMTDNLFETLCSHFETQNRGKNVSEDRYVFPRSRPNDGQPRKKNSFWHSFKRVCRRAKIVDLRPHDLRHDCATRLVRAGVPLRVIKDWLGHSDIRTTLKYAHLADPDAAFLDAASRLM